VPQVLKCTQSSFDLAITDKILLLLMKLRNSHFNFVCTPTGNHFKFADLDICNNLFTL
jgi:hypothetical protein